MYIFIYMNKLNIKKSDRYSLNCNIEEISDSELRNLKFGLNFRWMEHIRKNHTLAAKSARDLSNIIRQELAIRNAKDYLAQK